MNKCFQLNENDSKINNDESNINEESDVVHKFLRKDTLKNKFEDHNLTQDNQLSQNSRQQDSGYDLNIDGSLKRRKLFSDLYNEDIDSKNLPIRYAMADTLLSSQLDDSIQNKSNIPQDFYSVRVDLSEKEELNGNVLALIEGEEYNPNNQKLRSNEENKGDDILQSDSQTERFRSNSLKSNSKKLQLQSKLTKKIQTLQQCGVFHKRSGFSCFMEKSLINGQCQDEFQKPKNYFIILSYIQKFVKSLILRVSYRDFSLLEPKHFQMIGDATCNFKMNNSAKKKAFIKQPQINDDDLYGFLAENDLLHRRRNLFKFDRKDEVWLTAKILYKKVKKLILDCKLFSFIFGNKIFEPDSLQVILWDLFILIIIISHLLIIPIKLCFSISIKYSSEQVLLYFIPFICFIFDMAVTFNTGIYEFGIVVKNRKIISRAYWKNKPSSHIFLILFLLLNFKCETPILEIIAIWIRLNEVAQRTNKINQHFQLTFKFPKTSELLKLLTLVLFVAHICGCGFHYVGWNSMISLEEENSWIVTQKLINENWTLRYIYSFYFSIVTMVTIGYGDVVPINIYERVYVLFMILFSCGIFAYCINAIGTIFLEQNTKLKAFQQKMFDVQEYLEIKSINKETRLRVFKYLEYLNEQSDETILKGQMILSECSQDLKEDILEDYYGKILKKLRILQNNFSKEFISQLSIKMKEQRFGPGEVILNQGTQLKNLYFIANGEVEYYIENGLNKIPTCSLQNSFRVIDFRLFASEAICPYSVRSMQTTIAAFITLDDFLNTAKEFPLDSVKFLLKRWEIQNYFYQEKFCMIKDQFVNGSRFENQCFSCGQFGHDICSCPQIHYHVNLPIFTQRIFHSKQQSRRKNQRRDGGDLKENKRIKFNSLAKIVEVKTSLKFVRWVNVQNKIENETINPIEEAEKIEKDRQFYLRCPKIKNNYLGPEKFEQTNRSNNNYSNFRTFGEQIASLKLRIQEQEGEEQSSDSSQSSYSEEYSDMNQSQKDNFQDKSEMNSNQESQQEESVPRSSLYYNSQKNNINSPDHLPSTEQINRLSIQDHLMCVKGSSQTSLGNWKDKKQSVNLTPSFQIIEVEEKEINLQLKDLDSNFQKKNILNKPLTYSLLKSQIEELLSKMQLLKSFVFDGGIGVNHHPCLQQYHKNSITSNNIASISPIINPQQSQPYPGNSQQIINMESKYPSKKITWIQKQPLQSTIQNENKNQSNQYLHRFSPKIKSAGTIAKEDQEHIFGKIAFSFDQMKEFQIYFPKFNCSNVVKSYKKLQQTLGLKNRKPVLSLIQGKIFGDQKSLNGSFTPRLSQQASKKQNI